MKRLYILIFISVNAFTNYSQSCHNVKELLRKRHTISGMTYGHPYTTFDRHNENYKNLQNSINNIRDRILLDKSISTDEKLRGPVYKAYHAIYTNAKLPRPTDNGINNGEDKSALAIWAKNNAFVFLVGLDGNANKLDTRTYCASRDSFRDRALNAFSYLNGVVKPHNFGEITLYDSDDSYMQHYCRSLIYWLQTYDLLKASYELRVELDSVAPHRYPWGFGDADRNTDGSCAPRRKLRDYARNIYTRSKDFDGIVEHAVGWKKNHGIAALPAVASVSLVNLLISLWLFS